MNKLGQPLPRLTEQRDKTQILNIRKEKWDISTDSTNMKRLLKVYYEQLRAHKFGNVDEIEQFLQ